VLDTLARLFPGIGDAVQEFIAVWRVRFWHDGGHPTHWGQGCTGVNETLLQVLVTDTRQQALAAYGRTVP
jgi:hypothetical protein